MIIGIRLSTKNEFQHHPYSDQKTVEIVYHTRTPLVEKAFHPPPLPCYGRYSDSTLCLYSSSFSNTLPTHTIISRPLLNSSPLSPFFTPPPEPTTPSFYRPAPIFERSGPRFPAHVINIFSTPFSNSVMPILRHERKGRTVKQQQQPLHDRSWLTIWWNFCAA